jgi:hypothetical protein
VGCGRLTGSTSAVRRHSFGCHTPTAPCRLHAALRVTLCSQRTRAAGEAASPLNTRGS